MIPRYVARWLWMRAGPFWSGGESVLLLVRRAKPSLRVGNWRMGFQTTNLESRVTSDTAQYGYVLRALVVRRRRAGHSTWRPRNMAPAAASRARVRDRLVPATQSGGIGRQPGDPSGLTVKCGPSRQTAIRMSAFPLWQPR